MTDVERPLGGAGLEFPADESGPDEVAGDECAAAVHRLWTYLDRELNDDDAAELRDHLAGCPPCLAEYSIDVVLKDLVRRSCRTQAPAGLRVRIYQTLLSVRLDG